MLPPSNTVCWLYELPPCAHLTTVSTVKLVTTANFPLPDQAATVLSVLRLGEKHWILLKSNSMDASYYAGLGAVLSILLDGAAVTLLIALILLYK